MTPETVVVLLTMLEFRFEMHGRLVTAASEIMPELANGARKEIL